MKVTWLFITVLVLGWYGMPKANAQGLTEFPVQGNTTDPGQQQTRASAEPFLPITVILTFDHMPNTADVDAIRALGVAYHRYNMLPMVTVTGLRPAIEGCSSLPGVVSVWSNTTVGFLGNLSREVIGADAVASALGFTGQGVGVAIVDTGIDASHPDLKFGSVVRENIKFTATDTSVIAASMLISEELSGHGTFCAGIVGGRGTASGGKYRGVAPGATLIGLGVGDLGAIVSVLEAYNWILNHHDDRNIKIVSNSWGTTGEYSPDDPVNVATKIMAAAGLSVVFSAGNSGPGASTINPYSVAPWVISVAASTDDGTALAQFSSKGTPGDPNLHPTVTAPGVYVGSCRSEAGLISNALDAAPCPVQNILKYGCNSGTSVAAAHVSGTLALMLEANPNLTPAQLKNIIVQSATPMPSYQQHEVGAGFLNAWNAVQLALRS